MKNTPSLFRQYIAGILVLSLTMTIACSTNAKLTKTDNTQVIGKITRSDAQTVYVDQFGRETQLKRSEIGDVSHPGRPLMWVGGGLVAGGAVSFLAGALFSSTSVTVSSGSYSSSSSSTNNSIATVYYVTGGILGVSGIICFFTGYSRYSTSKDNLEAGGGMALWSPAPGVHLGYQTIMQMPVVPTAGAETIHQGKLSFRF